MNLSVVLTKNYQGKEWSLIGADYSGLNWLDSSPKPEEVELLAQWEALEVEAADRVAAKQAAKETAHEKLSGWGLTPDEIAAIITP